MEFDDSHDSETARLMIDVEDGATWSERPQKGRIRFPGKYTPYRRTWVLLGGLIGTLTLVGFLVSSRGMSWGKDIPEVAVFDELGNILQHPHYLVFERPATQPIPVTERPVRSVRRLPDACIETNIAYGAACSDETPVTFDLVWTWVNGSDPRLEQAIAETAAKQTPPRQVEAAKDPESKLYRDHDELRHSFRSVLKNFRPYIRKFHLFASDFPFTEDEFMRNETQKPGSLIVPNNATVRLGQLPSWLIPGEDDVWRDGNVELTAAYQSQVFENYTGTTFNSLGIETQIPAIPDIEHTIIYLNDDFFFTADLQPSDFYTPAYGTVLRFDVGFLIPANRADDKADPAGEWGPLGTAAWLLSERFGERGRPYPKHAPKPFPIAMLEESVRMWAPEMRTTLSHKFRGMRDSTGQWDAYITFLTSHLIIERSREALLWSWIVGRVGGNKDEWGPLEKTQAWRELGGDPHYPEKDIHVSLTDRETMTEENIVNNLKSSGLNYSRRTKYQFSSLDGYPYAYKNPNGNTVLPDFKGEHLGQHLCDISYDCINRASSASEAFKNMAFKDVECGDCVIGALRTASGRLGLSTFLPSPSREFTPSASAVEREVAGDEEVKNEEDAETQHIDPHLPFSGRWQDVDFSLKSILHPFGSVNIRAWAIRLVERYKFVIGETEALFLMIETPEKAKSMLSSVGPDNALLCVNDDVKEGFREADKVIRRWQEERWPTPAEWEQR